MSSALLVAAAIVTAIVQLVKANTEEIDMGAWRRVFLLGVSFIGALAVVVSTAIAGEIAWRAVPMTIIVVSLMSNEA